MSVALAGNKDDRSFMFTTSKGDMIYVSRDVLNAKNASRKADREYIVAALIGLMARHGAQVDRRDDGPNPGYHGASIGLHFTLNGVGAMLDIDSLHGGGMATIHWYNTEYPARNFTSRFCTIVGAHSHSRPHHKATSCPNDWFALAMMLDGGLCLANRGSALDP